MRFKNRLSDKPLRFTVDKLYDVEPGGYVEIPDKYVYAVKAMGVLLDEAPVPAPKSKPKAE